MWKVDVELTTDDLKTSCFIGYSFFCMKEHFSTEKYICIQYLDFVLRIDM